MKRQRLNTKYPCCGGRCVLQAVQYVPIERYTRVCSHCGQRWDIERTTLKTLPDGTRFDKLDWARN